MDILPFVNRNGLWYLDKPEFLKPNISGHAPLVMGERGIAELLDTLAGNTFFNYLNLEFHYTPIHPYDAKLIKAGINYQCVSIYGVDTDSMIWIPSPVFRAMVSNSNPEKIYISVIASVTNETLDKL